MSRTFQVLVTVDYRGLSRFGGDYKLAYDICQALKKTTHRSKLFNINDPLEDLSFDRSTDIFFVVCDTFWSKSTNADAFSGTFCFRKALADLSLPFVGSSFETVKSSSSGNKIRARDILSTAVPIPDSVVMELDPADDISLRYSAEMFRFPIVCKLPFAGGLSIGVNYVESYRELLDLAYEHSRQGHSHLLCETFIAGLEYTCWVFEDQGVPYCYGALAILKPDESKIFSAADKRLAESAQLEDSARCNQQIAHDIPEIVKTTAVAAHRVLKLRHYSRVDLIYSDEKAYVIDANARPSLYQSSIGHVAQARNDSYAESLSRLVIEGGSFCE